MLLLVVLYTSWLYISINATKVNKARWSEAKLLTKSLSGHFVVLQIFFIGGIFLAYLGCVLRRRHEVYDLQLVLRLRVSHLYFGCHCNSSRLEDSA